PTGLGFQNALADSGAETGRHGAVPETVRIFDRPGAHLEVALTIQACFVPDEPFDRRAHIPRRRALGRCGPVEDQSPARLGRSDAQPTKEANTKSPAESRSAHRC
ncbi:MAG: hypothetical protein JW940_21360, partial [Polyangiaceae bacterium]|nr:hypothetical protein [Polyangiaceae bacterium]